MSNPSIENKILQLLLISCDVSPTVVREYFKHAVLQPNYNQSFKEFLKDGKIKHQIVHLYYNRSKCCMDRCKLSKQSILKEEQFKTLYPITGSVPHQETSKNGTVTKHCVCFLEPVDSIEQIDLSLMWILLNNLFRQTLLHVGFVEIVKDVRNYICHLPSSQKVSEQNIDDKLTVLTQTLGSLSVLSSQGKMFQKAVKKQIEYIRMGTFKAVDVDKIIREAKEHSDVKTMEIIEMIEVTSRSLQEHTTNLATGIIQVENENKNCIVENIQNSREYVTEVVIECREQEKEQLEEMQVVQRMVIDTQSVHGETIERIDNTTMETHRETVEQTEMITKIKEDVTGLEHLDERMPTKEDVVNISSLNEKIKGQPENFEIIYQRHKEEETQTEVYHSNVDTQTGIESLQFELAAESTSKLRTVLLGNEDVDNTSLKNLLVESRKQNETGRVLLENMNHGLDTLKNTTAGQLESIGKMHEKTLEDISSAITMAQDKDTMTRITMEKDIFDLREVMQQSFASLSQGVAESGDSLKLCHEGLREVKRAIYLSRNMSDVVKQIDQHFKQLKLSDEARALRDEERLYGKLKEIADTTVTHTNSLCTKLIETTSAQSQETVRQITERIERKFDEKIPTTLQNQDISREAEKYEKEKNELKEQIERLKSTSLQTLLETEGYTKADGAEDFITIMINGTLDKHEMKRIDKYFVHFPKFIELLAKTHQEWLKMEDEDHIPSICYIHKGESIFLADYCKTIGDIFSTITKNMQQICECAEDLWSKLERLMSRIKSDIFQLLLDALHSVFTSIVNIPNDDLMNAASENEKHAAEFRRKVKRFIQEDVWMEKLTNIADTCTELTDFFDTFAILINSLRNKATNIGTMGTGTLRSDSPKYRFLLTDIMCKQVCDLFTNVCIVICTCRAYEEMSREVLMPMIKTLNVVISKPKEQCLSVHLTCLENKEGVVSEIVAKHRKRMKEQLTAIF